MAAVARTIGSTQEQLELGKAARLLLWAGVIPVPEGSSRGGICRGCRQAEGRCLFCAVLSLPGTGSLLSLSRCQEGLLGAGWQRDFPK